MADLGHELWFGVFLTPEARLADRIGELARLADQLGLDLAGVQDHPYQPRFLDMWTLLSTLAAQTTRLRLVPDVVNLPLRPPAMLARAAASLDILSGGRVELGLGAGAFADGVVAMGGPRREPREAVGALAEAIQIIRSLWQPGRAVSFEGQHYHLRGAQPGPLPAHPIGIWLGAYKPQMLRLTGQMADGWAPSLPYAPPAELSAMTQMIDEAAQDAGRAPAAVRRVYNINGQFSAAESGFLQGPPRLWIEQLTELALSQGMSVFVLSPGANDVDDIQRFAEEVAPGVREAVARARSQGQAPAPTRPPTPLQAATPLRAGPAPRTTAFDEQMRPHMPRGEAAPVTLRGRQSQETLIQIHDHLRQELAQIRAAAVEVAAARMTPSEARSLINRMTMRQNYWTLGAFCAQYCRVVSIHHTIEDTQLFPSLQRADQALGPVLERLHWEHEIIAEQIDRFDRALGRMIGDPSAVAEVQRVADELGDTLLSHLAYEEDELLGPLGQFEMLV